jgi:hypothetical protein
MEYFFRIFQNRRFIGLLIHVFGLARHVWCAPKNIFILPFQNLYLWSLTGKEHEILAFRESNGAEQKTKT